MGLGFPAASQRSAMAQSGQSPLGPPVYFSRHRVAPPLQEGQPGSAAPTISAKARASPYQLGRGPRPDTNRLGVRWTGAVSQPRRRDAPTLRRRGRGAVPTELADDAARQQAVQDLRDNFWASSNRHVVESKMLTVRRILEYWSLDPFPPSVDKIHFVGAGLRLGNYSSAATYLSSYKGFAEREGWDWGPAEKKAVQDATRSCVRGLGAPEQALALPFDDLSLLSGQRAALSHLGPLSPRNVVILGVVVLDARD